MLKVFCSCIVSLIESLLCELLICMHLLFTAIPYEHYTCNKKMSQNGNPQTYVLVHHYKITQITKNQSDL